MNHRELAPPSWNEHWDSMPNSVKTLYATVALRFFPFIHKEIHIEAWGQLCFDDAAARATAYHLYNYFPRHGKDWKMISWRCEMNGPCVGNAKTNGLAPENWKVSNYVGR